MKRKNLIIASIVITNLFMKKKNLIIASIVIIAYLVAAMVIGGRDWQIWLKIASGFVISSFVVAVIMKLVIFGDKK